MSILAEVHRRHGISQQFLTGLKWRLHIAKLQWWKDQCNEAERRHQERIDNGEIYVGLGPFFLIREMQRRVGINPHKCRVPRGGPKPDITNEGKVGYRSCSASQWDNVIRASDEDR